MTSIAKLKGIASQEAERLKGQGIKSIDDLWERIGQDPDHGIEALAAQAGIDDDRLTDLLAEQAVHESRPGIGTWLERHMLEWALIAAFLALVLSAVLSRSMTTDAAPKELVVASEVGLSAFHLIGAGDVRLVEGPAEPGTFTSSKDVEGRYSFQAIPAGVPLRSEQLSAVRLSPQDLDGRQILTMPIAKATLSATAVAGGRVSLLVSPRDGSETSLQPLLLDDVILLAVERDGDATSVVVAINADEIAALAALLGRSEIFVLQPVP
jgi:hypothetical protein